MKILPIAVVPIALQFVMSPIASRSLSAQLLEASPIEGAGAPVGTVIERIVYLSDGLRVAGYRASPVEGVDLPVIIVNRGGNRDFGQWSDERAASRLGEIASWGYVVLASQHRGVDGGDWIEEFGGADVHDVLNLLQVAGASTRADTTRVGMYGWSRGGMMTYLALRISFTREPPSSCFMEAQTGGSRRLNPSAWRRPCSKRSTRSGSWSSRGVFWTPSRPRGSGPPWPRRRRPETA